MANVEMFCSCCYCNVFIMLSSCFFYSQRHATIWKNCIAEVSKGYSSGPQWVQSTTAKTLSCTLHLSLEDAKNTMDIFQKCEIFHFHPRTVKHWDNQVILFCTSIQNVQIILSFKKAFPQLIFQIRYSRFSRLFFFMYFCDI